MPLFPPFYLCSKNICTYYCMYMIAQLNSFLNEKHLYKLPFPSLSHSSLINVTPHQQDHNICYAYTSTFHEFNENKIRLLRPYLLSAKTKNILCKYGFGFVVDKLFKSTFLSLVKIKVNITKTSKRTFSTVVTDIYFQEV